VDHNLVAELASCIIAAWALAVIAHIFKQPLILAYLVAGFAIGPNGPQVLRWVEKDQHIELISEIGLSLLLFMIGLEIDLKKMLRAGRAISLTAGTQILGGCLLGLLFFSALGFHLGKGRLDALYLAIAAALSSTVIIVKILYDKRELDTLAGRITLGVLVLQDLFAILFLALQPNLQHPSFGVIAVSMGKVVLLVAAAFLASKFLLPPLFRAKARVPELVLVGALAWCFIVAGLASWLGLSTFPYTLDVAAKVTSLRDFFVTLFFVALGMKIPSPTLPLLVGAIGMAAFVIASRMITVFPVLHCLGLGHRVSLLPAINLSQVSEFSLVILILGLKSGHIDAATLDLGAYSFALMAVGSSYAVTRSDAIVRWASPLLLRMKLRDLEDTIVASKEAKPARVMLLGFFTTASSLLTEIERTRPEWVKDLAVLDFSPIVHQRLRQRKVRVAYADISQRDTLHHAGVSTAEILICTLPDTILKGTNNLTLVRQLRELNPSAKIIATAETFAAITALYSAGADYVNVPRVNDATQLCAVLGGALNNTLPALRADQQRQLAGRDEILN
jgi:Kef-type K+ transport system membrane component KefB